MAGIKNSNVNKEVDRLLSPLKERDLAKYNIIRTLLDDVYDDPSLASPEATTKEIENNLYRVIDNHVRFTDKNSEK